MNDDVFAVDFEVSKKEFDEWRAQMPTREQAAQIREAHSAGYSLPLDFPELIGEKIMEIKAGYGVLTLTVQALGAGFRCFRVCAQACMECCRDSGACAFANIEPEEFYSNKGFALQLFDCGLDIVNVRFVA